MGILNREPMSREDKMVSDVLWNPVSVYTSWFTDFLAILCLGLPSLWDLMSNDLRWSLCNSNRNKVHNKYVIELS